MKLQLNLLFVAAGTLVACAPDAPSSRSAVTIGCVGKEASNPKCKIFPATSGDASGQREPAGNPPAGNPPAGNPPAGNPPAGNPPAVQEPPAPQPPPKTQPDFLGEIIKIIGDGVKSGGSGGNADAGAGGNADAGAGGSADAGAGGNADAGAGGSADAGGGAQPAPPPAPSSVSLTTRSGTYIKKSATSVGSTWVDGKDYCLVGSGATITVQCIASYNDTHYRLKGSSACSALTVSYILKSGLNTPSRISSSCP